MRTKLLSFALILCAALVSTAQDYNAPFKRRAAGPASGCDDYSGLIAWWDESDLPGSGSVSSWADSSGNGNTMTEATNQPDASTLGTGKAADFNGSDDELTTSATFGIDGDANDEDYTFAVVFQIESLSVDIALIGNQATNARFLRIESDGSAGMRGASDVTEIMTATGEFTTATLYRVITGRDSSGNLFIYKNGVDVTSGTPSNTTEMDQDQMAASQSSNWFNGLIGTMCVWENDHEASVSGIDSMLDDRH